MFFTPSFRWHHRFDFHSKMDSFGGLAFSDVSSAAVRKKRSTAPRRPWSESQPHLEFPDISSSTPPSENNVVNMEEGSCGESDEASNNGSFQASNEKRHSRRHTEGVLAPVNWRSTNDTGSGGDVSGGIENERKVKKVKLKVGGVIRTFDAKSVSDGASAVGSCSTRSSHFPAYPHQVSKSIVQDNSDDHSSFPPENDIGREDVHLKDSSRGGLSFGKAKSSRIPDEIISEKQTEGCEPVRKSRRIPKRKLLEGEMFDDGDDVVDDEIRYLEKIKSSRAASDYSEENENGGRRHRKVSKRNIDDLYDIDVGDYGSTGVKKDGKKSRSGRAFEDADYMEDEEPISDVEPENRRKKARKEVVELGNSRMEMTVTTRQRAHQTGTDILSVIATNQVEFPNGLPPAPPKKQKEKLSDVEQQLKKTEAAQRRRMQVEKAARESEAEAIRRILGQDSSRKKREDKIKRKQEELAQERAANVMLASDSVRWVIGPSGTVVTFPDEVGLPSIFDSKCSSYPPPREKCAGPSCSNPYKYRDSKSKLPLCSLQCYKAIHEKMPSVSAC